MSKIPTKNIVAALDIGTSKVTALIGQIQSEGSVELIGLGTQPCRGLKKGVVVNLDLTVQAISQAVKQAQEQANVQMESVYVALAGAHIQSMNSHGIVAIRDQEVTLADVDRVVDAAKAVVIGSDQKILHILPQEFTVDYQEGIRDPIGMSGVRLETEIHMITGAVSAAQNLITCIRRCGLEIEDLVFSPLADSEAVLTAEEKELGVCLIDIGAGTTDVAFYNQGVIRQSIVLPVAGDQLTQDISVALRIPTPQAEEIKLTYGCALARLLHNNQTFVVPGAGDRPSKQVADVTLAHVIESRMEEILVLIKQQLPENARSLLGAGLVLTGGSAQLPGLVELAEEIFGVTVRVGLPGQTADPAQATGVGLLQYGLEQQKERQEGFVKRLPGFWGKMRNWFWGQAV